MELQKRRSKKIERWEYVRTKDPSRVQNNHTLSWSRVSFSPPPTSWSSASGAGGSATGTSDEFNALVSDADAGAGAAGDLMDINSMALNYETVPYDCRLHTFDYYSYHKLVTAFSPSPPVERVFTV